MFNSFTLSDFYILTNCIEKSVVDNDRGTVTLRMSSHVPSCTSLSQNG